jgi:hypothetical protein
MKGAFHATLSLFHTPHDAPTRPNPPNNKSIANQSLHQRSGFSFGYLQRLSDYCLGYVYKSYEYNGYTANNGVLLHMLPQIRKDRYLSELEALKLRVLLCLECLRTDEFKEFKSDKAWKKISEKINLLPPHTVYILEIKGAFEEFLTERLRADFSLETLCQSWETFLTQVETEISKFETPASEQTS